ncbi:class I SAM-dependent methyltransferase [Christiangramia aquimixticola]|uniref:class I SAM-dependent methyltransferase n=1 Tax=Christiangramia aquimixticola TaxID=1697558 RepID=UPI003AA928E5
MTFKKDKFKIQENEYHFPYHYIPYLDKEQNVVNHRSIDWGFKYFSYLLRIKTLVEKLQPSSILDIGCGEGRFLGLLDSKIERKVGVDLSERPIQFAKAFHPNIQFYSMDASYLKEEFDIVTAIEVLEHIPDNEIPHFFNILEKRLKNNGSIILSVPTTVVPVSKKHYRHYNLSLFKEQLISSKAPLKITHVEYVYQFSRLLKFYAKLTQNKYWIIEIRFLRNLVWRLVQSNFAIANEKNGEEMIIVLRK